MPNGMDSTPSERFRAWLEWTGESQEAVAERLGCSQSAISKTCAGKRRLGMRLAHAVERESATWPHGPIRSSEWVEDPERERLAG